MKRVFFTFFEKNFCLYKNARILNFQTPTLLCLIYPAAIWFTIMMIYFIVNYAQPTFKCPEGTEYLADSPSSAFPCLINNKIGRERLISLALRNCRENIIVVKNNKLYQLVSCTKIGDIMASELLNSP